MVSLFDELPSGFTYLTGFISEEEEAALLAGIERLEFSAVRMRGVTARRRVAQFGFHYSFETFRLSEALPVPAFLIPLRARAAALAGVVPDALVETLVTEYSPGATIGWHRDLPVFGVIVGVSVGGSCTLKLRRRGGGERPLTVPLSPRSAYVLDDEARRDWEHSIPAVKETRFSVTFRTMKARDGK